jgi:Ca2+-binding RTX toxin-like protein
MAYNVTGTNGSDNLDQTADTGPGTIVGQAGDDTVVVGSGFATVTGDSGSDSILLQTGNTGTVSGGTEGDEIAGRDDNIGSMVLLGGDGADIIVVFRSSSDQTIVGGNDSADGADHLVAGGGDDIIFGNGGADDIAGNGGNDTVVGGFDADFIADSGPVGGSELIFGNEGGDYVQFYTDGSDTLFAGQGDDSVFVTDDGDSQLFMNEGADTVAATSADGNLMIVGGNGSDDGGDSILSGGGTDWIFGNGGAEDIVSGGGGDTVAAGFGNDTVAAEAGADLVFGNENNDNLHVGDGNDTAFGGLGNDIIIGGAGTDTIQGNEGNDTIAASGGIDTISGGTGNDVFVYFGPADDGDNGAAGGPVEWITDLDWAADRFEVFAAVDFAAAVGAGAANNLSQAASNAITAADALAGPGAQFTAAQFTFSGRTYLAMDQVTPGAFDDAEDLLLDITGVTGTIDTDRFFINPFA